MIKRYCPFLASTLVLAVLTLTVLRAEAAPQIAKSQSKAPVTVTDNGGTWTLDNGIVRATVNKNNGSLESLFYKGADTMGHDQGTPGVWEEDPSPRPGPETDRHH